MNAEHTDIQRFRESLAQAIGADRYELWFSEPHTLELQGNRLVVSSDPFTLERVRSQFGSVLQELVEAESGETAQLAYVAQRPGPLAPSVTGTRRRGKPERIDSAAASRESAAATSDTCDAGRTQSAGRSTVSRANASGGNEHGVASTRRETGARSATASCEAPRGLRGLVLGDENRLARAAVQQILASPGELSPLFLHGPVGSGKSAVLAAIAQAPSGTTPARRRVVVSAEQFTTLFVEALKGRGLPSFRQKFREIDLLAIDDLQFFHNKQATLVEFKHTLDHLTQRRKQVVLAADRPPQELGFFEPELLNRLCSGLVCGLQYPDVAARQGILHELAREHAVQAEPSVLTAIAQRLSGDVRQLRGAVIRLKAATLSGLAVADWSSVEPLLADLLSAQQKTVSWAAIEQAVCDVCGVSEADLKSPKRSEQVNVARNLAMWLSRKHIGVAYADIGRHYGGRSHSTVISANNKVTQWLEEGNAVRVGPRSACPVAHAVRAIETKLKIG